MFQIKEPLGIASTEGQVASGVASTVKPMSVVDNSRVLSVARTSPRLNGRRWGFYYLVVGLGERCRPFEEAILRLRYDDLGDLAMHLFELGVTASMTVGELYHRLEVFTARAHDHQQIQAHNKASERRYEEETARNDQLRKAATTHIQEHIAYRAIIGKPLHPFVVRKVGA